ncbi:hypothetical protein [Plantactinospora sp. B5E13]|uniref:hypothetical protein n=1 Tax=unclassified Plantactinospora TaxID=2631981 RepID=UPI00325F08C6
MRRTPARIGAGLIASTVLTVGLGVAAAPASAAATEESGLTFYDPTFTTPVLHLDAPTGECLALPPTAGALVGWSGFTDVETYRTTDCTGYAVSNGTLRTFTPGSYQSFRAF